MVNVIAKKFISSSLRLAKSDNFSENKFNKRETCNKRPLVFEILSFNFAFYSLSLIISLVNSFWFFSGTNSSKLNDMALNSSSAAKINLTVVMIHKEYY